MDLRPILYINGIFLCVLALFMTVPLFIDFYHYNIEWVGFAISSGLSGFCGVLLILGNKQDDIQIVGREAFLLTVLSWAFLCLFSAFPFVFTLPTITLTDAIFESVSGLTTTGSTVLTGLNYMPPGILMWRSLLQWIGGVGIIVMAISILPFLKVGGMQLFRMESSEKEKALPRVTQLSAYIIAIYVAMSVLCAISYYFAGMAPFDAIAHAMTTISTGGFSTWDTSFGEMKTFYPELVAIVFMILGCIPSVLYIKMLSNGPKELLNDQQTVGFLKTCLVLCLIMIIYLTSTLDKISPDIVVEATFTTISLLSTTGYADTDYILWGGFASTLLIFSACIGGCAGSTSCGIKIFRIQILYAVAKNQLQQLLYPNGVFTIDYNKQPLSVNVAASVMALFFVFIASLAGICLALMACGLDLPTSLSGAAATLANAGPGVGNIIGPTGTYQSLPDNAKWILISSMMLGRLEFFTILVFFMPRFWRQ